MAIPNKVSRRDFLKVAGTLTLAGVAASCVPATTATPAAATQVAATQAQPTAKPTAAAIDPYGKYATAVVLKTVRSFDATEKLPEGDTPEKNQYTRYVKDMLNIETQYLWTAANTDYNQKVNLAIASNDIPDAMVVNLAQFKQMIKAGQLADLTDTYNQYVSPKVKQMMDSSKGMALKAITDNARLWPSRP